ncbi:MULTISPECIES: hypothetical protein [Streptomyces]|uniref:hypothetical protein n=1 Tax=Streptomyces TaxID=1883 RepID=UPI000FA32379|nr:hypothetical protein [Streptomyces sp. WAC08452]RSS28330.1 hypothetical protein EF916_17225 [Streptomyces sp. WAC08452]
MAHLLANGIPPHLLMWRRVREYAVPPSMIEKATARRAVGDWAGACAAARTDVDLDLRAVRDRHGTELATRLRADLRRLAPDLLRWHMPRIAPDGRLRPGLTLNLARYGAPGPSAVHLVVRTPPARADAGQRMSLALWDGSRRGPAGHHPHPHPHRRFRLDLHRHLWDAVRSADLARRCPTAGPGHGADHGPGHGAATGLGLREHPGGSWAVECWAAEAEHLLRADGLPRGAFTVRLDARTRAVFELVAPDDGHAPTLRPPHGTLPPQEVAALPVLPEAAVRVPPDLELLRAGLITVEDLHPLVAAALSPPGAPPAATAARPAPEGTPAVGSGDPHTVECRGEVHRIALRDGVLTAVDHHPDQVRREELLVALGGPPLPCLRAIDTAHRSPEALPAVRERLVHGDFAGALAVVESLLGPGALLRDGPLRDALRSAASRRIDDGLFRSGLVAEHPAARATRTEQGHRPRTDRRSPRALRSKRGSRQRPRTALTG